MAYYSQQDVTQFVSQIKTKGSQKEYLAKAAASIGKLLLERPSRYKSFGPYWWAIKKHLLSKFYKGDAWFKGNQSDSLTMERNWHDDEFRTIVAGLVYHSEQLEHTSSHSYEHNGISKPYTLLDHDAELQS